MKFKKIALLSVPTVMMVAGLVFLSGFTFDFNANNTADRPGITEYERLTANFETGSPDYKSIGELAFGPEGILFFGDSPGAGIYALDTGERESPPANKPLNIPGIRSKIAQHLGAAPGDVSIEDMAVNPATAQVYLSLRRGQGNNASYHLVNVSADGSLEEVGLDNVRFSKFDLQTVPGPDATDRRGRSLRSASITDLHFANGTVYIAGLSNEEFASGFRQVSFPFEGKESLSTLEIYHVSHGQYETNAPIRTFIPYSMDDGNYIVAGYTCTPLVLFPLDNLEDGEHVKGRTVAELGNRNRPLDIVPVSGGSGEALYIANSSYSVMRVNPQQFNSQPHLDSPLDDGEHTKGVEFETLPHENVLHLDNLNDSHLVMLQEGEDGTVDLKSIKK